MPAEERRQAAEVLSKHGFDDASLSSDDDDASIKKTDELNGSLAWLTEVWNLMVSGRLKVQEHLHNWRSEFRKYHRDEKGKIVKNHDHLMDATRYLVVSGRQCLRMAPKPQQGFPPIPTGANGWLGE